MQKKQTTADYTDLQSSVFRWRLSRGALYNPTRDSARTAIGPNRSLLNPVCICITRATLVKLNLAAGQATRL